MSRIPDQLLFTFDLVRSFVVFLLIVGIGCSQPLAVQDVALTSLDGSPTSINPKDNALTIIYFLSPECPLCINYSLALRKLEQQFQSDRIIFFGIYSKEWFTPSEVELYTIKYKLGFEMLLDDGNQLAKSLGATVTPEVFVLDDESTILYSGKIDNWVNDLGKKKLEVSEPYLENAILAWKNGQTIDPRRTEPKGCLIE